MTFSKEDFKKALLSLRDDKAFRNSKYLTLLRAQYAGINHTITAQRLADSAGYKNFNAANLHYGHLARLIAEKLDYVPEEKHKNGDTVWWVTIASGTEASESTIDGHFEFTMKPELALALEEMKWVKK